MNTTTLNADLISVLVPSLHVAVEPWVLATGRDVKCNALASVPSGAITKDRQSKMGAPVCTNTVEQTEIHVDVQELKFDRDRISVRPGKSGFIEMFPNNRTIIDSAVTLIRHHKGEFKESKGKCTAIGVSSLHAALIINSRWRSIFTDAEQLSHAMQEHVCMSYAEQHAKENGEIPIVTVPNESLNKCSERALGFVNGTCLVSLPEVTSYTTTIPNISAFILQTGSIIEDDDKGGFNGLPHNENEKSFVCLSASISITHVFLTKETVSSLNENLKPSFPAMIPVKYTILNEENVHCERVAHVLGRAALVYSRDEAWRETPLGLLEDVRRFHTFLIAVGSAQFPLSLINVTSKSEWCALRDVHEVTEIPVDWRVGLFLAAAFTACVLCLLAIGFRFWYRGKSWIVGSAQWALKQMEKESQKQKKKSMSGKSAVAENEDDEELQIEVIVESTRHCIISSSNSNSSSSSSNSCNGNSNGCHDGNTGNGNSRKYQQGVGVDQNSLIQKRTLVQGLTMEPPFTYQLRTVTKSKDRTSGDVNVKDGGTGTDATKTGSQDRSDIKNKENDSEKSDNRSSASDNGSTGSEAGKDQENG